MGDSNLVKFLRATDTEKYFIKILDWLVVIMEWITGKVEEFNVHQDIKRKLEALTDPTLIDRMLADEQY